MIFTLNEYLDRLRNEQQKQPDGERKRVPTLTTLAEDVGISRSQMQRLAGNQTEGMKFNLGGAIIKSLRLRGFSTDVSDILKYYEN